VLTKYNNIEYIMPFLFCNDIFIPILHELLKKQENPIKYVYGCIKSVWSAGRVSKYTIKNLNIVENHLNKLKEYNVTPVLTFSRLDFDNEQLNDEFCNNLLDIAYNCNAQFILASDKLYKYIKSRYKEAKTVCSVIVPSINQNSIFFNETKFYNNMLKKYDYVVLRPEYTTENALKLNKLISDIDRVEIIINGVCAYNCKYALAHYKLIERGETSSNIQCIKNCHSQKGVRTNKISEEIIENIIEAGVKKIKLQGRDYNFDVMLKILINYFFSSGIPQDEVINKIKYLRRQYSQNNINLPPLFV